jgi:flagellar assembly protein FliH
LFIFVSTITLPLARRLAYHSCYSQFWQIEPFSRGNIKRFGPDAVLGVHLVFEAFAPWRLAGFMGVLKGSQIRFTEQEAVIGAEIIRPEEQALFELNQLVPAAEPLSEAGPLDMEEMPDIDLEDVDELFDVPTQVTPTPAPVDPVRDYEQAQKAFIHAEADEADAHANAQGEAIQQHAPRLMQEALDQAGEALAAANPTGDFARVAPYVQRQVAIQLDLEMLGSVNEIRWTHLKATEDNLVQHAYERALHVAQSTPQEAFAALMLEREGILAQARLEAERLVMEAMTRSAESMAQAEEAQAQTMLELEKQREAIIAELRKQAYHEGYNEGKAAGEAQAAVYVSEALQKLNEIAIAFPNAVKQNEEKLIKLALTIASKVIQQEISLQPEIVQRTVETALKRVSDLEQVVIKVNPLDLDLILPKQDAFRALMPDVQNFSIEGSHTIARGGCIIETNSGGINATIDAQIGIIDELFRQVRAEYEDSNLDDMEDN